MKTLTAPTIMRLDSISEELRADAQAIAESVKLSFARALHERQHGKPWTRTGVRTAWRRGYAAGYMSDRRGCPYDRLPRTRRNILAGKAFAEGLAAGQADAIRHAGLTWCELSFLDATGRL